MIHQRYLRFLGSASCLGLLVQEVSRRFSWGLCNAGEISKSSTSRSALDVGRPQCFWKVRL